MSANFNLEAFCSKAQLILDNKSFISSNDYILQLEQLLHEAKTGQVPIYSNPELEELQSYLEKAKSRINSLFYNAPVGYCVIDKNGILVTTNKAFCRLFLLDETAIDGDDLRKYIHPESLELFDFQISKIIASRNTLSTNLRFYQAKKEVFIRFQTTYYNEAGNDYLQCVATDISDTKAIEKELAASEAQFRNLLEASPVGMIVLYKGKCIYTNKAGAGLLEYDNPDELIGISAIEMVAEASKPMTIERLQRLENNLPNAQAEVEITCRNGQHKTCETASIPVIFNNRVSSLVMISDISARKNDEKLTRESEKKYKEMYQMLRLMCDNVPDMIWAKDLDNQYVFANKALSEGLLNASDTNEPIGKTDMFFAQREREQHSENPEWHTFGEICRDTDSIIIQNNKAQRFDEYGNIKGEFLFLDVYKAPFYNSNGNIIGTVGSGRNVTNERWLQREHEKILNELTTQSARLNAVINVLPDLMFILNTNGDFIDFFATDPARLAVDPKNIKDLKICHLFTPEEVDRQLKIYRNCIETHTIQSFEYNLTAEGNLLTFEARVAPLNTDSVLAIVRDITVQKQNELQLKKYTEELITAKEKAEKSDKLKSAFLSNMSHEIRTPLNSIMGFADLLNETDLDTEKRQQFTNIIISRSSDLLQLINDILDVANIESGNTTIYTTSCDLNKMLDQLQTSFSSRLQSSAKSNIRLVCEKALDLGHVVFDVDETKLKQIFVNLLDNAIKFTEQGTIRFGYQMPENGIITCFVSDTGIGIDPKHHDIIFKHFRQADSSDKYTRGGTGLGLTICKGNAGLMGGNIRVESEPGKGSRFFIQLPFVQRTENGNINTQPKVISGFDWKGKNILIVEDDDQNVKYLQIILRKTGVKIYQVSDSNSFRELFARIPDIHLILMDIQLPGEDGWQLTQYAKSVRSDVPIIAQTAYGLESDRVKSLEFGCDNFIAKPISPGDLLKMIALYLEN
jgi:PAS domain S-box-containing protein